jgi:disulfide bond formation protein DsbB
MCTMNHNPYSPPKTAVADPVATDGEESPASGPLYSVNQITLAAFLGTAVAAGWLAASNFRSIDQPNKARQWLWIGIGVGALTMILAFLVPDNFPSSIIAIIVTVGARAVAQKQFNYVLHYHERAGGDIRSWWRVVGISLLACAIFVLAVILVLLVYELATGNLAEL